MLKGDEPGEDLFTATEAAAIKGVSPSTVRRAAQTGRLKAKKWDGAVWQVRRRDLEAWALEREGGPKEK